MNDARLSARSECYGTALERHPDALLRSTTKPSHQAACAQRSLPSSPRLSIATRVRRRSISSPTTSYWTARDSGIRFARLSAKV